MSNKVVGTGQIDVAKDDEILEALGVGSCVVVCLYDRTRKIGGMAHIMLPERNNKPDGHENSTAPAEFVEQGIQNLLELFKGHGGETENLEVKLFGGAEMFENINKEPVSLGTLNLDAVKKKLDTLGFEVVSEDIGGNAGRSLKFFLHSGDVEVRKRV
jgi:chemotaxis protein CheD